METLPSGVRRAKLGENLNPENLNLNLRIKPYSASVFIKSPIAM